MKKNKLFLTAGLAAVIAIGIFIYALNNSKFEVKFDMLLLLWIVMVVLNLNQYRLFLVQK